MELVKRHGYIKISLHDDFECLDPETSGRRPRMGWRSRNASAFETWPDNRGSSANLRGASLIASGRSMSQQLSHRDDFYQPDQEMFNSRGWWVSPAVASQNRGRETPNQRGTNMNQRGAYANQRGINANQRGMNANQRGAYANQRGINTNEQWTYVTQRERGTYANQRGINMNQRGMNANQRGTNTNRRGTNANQRGTNINQRGTFSYLRGSQHGANANRRGASESQRRTSNQRATQTSQRQADQRGLQANQHGLPTSPGIRAMSRLPANRGGLSLNHRESARGRTSLSQRGTNVDPGRSSLERKTPRWKRETSAQTNPPREKLRPFKPQPPKVQENPWRASVSDSALGQAKDNLAHQRETPRAQRQNAYGAPVDQRGSPVGQRGSLADRRRSSPDQRGSPVGQHGSRADRRRSPADKRGTTVDQRGSMADRRRSSPDQRRSLVGQLGSLTDRRRSSPDQRGSPVGQHGSPGGLRGSPASQRRTPVDQLGSPVDQHGSLADRRQSSEDRRRSLADRRRSSDDQRGSLSDRRQSSEDQRASLADRRRSSDDQRGNLSDRRRSSDDQRGSLSDRRRSSDDQRGNLSDRRRSSDDQHESLLDRSRSSDDQRESLLDRRRSSEDQRGNLSDRRRSSDDQRGNLSDRRQSSEDQRRTTAKKSGPTGDQHEMSEQLRLSSAMRPVGRMRDSSPNKVRFEKPPPSTTMLKKWVSRWRSRRSADSSKEPEIKQEKEKSTKTSEQRPEWDQLDTAEKYEELHKAETDAKGLEPDSLMFRDGFRRIDMVITYKQEVGWDGEVTEAEARHQRRRSFYQANLLKEGLELELEHESLSFSGKVWFLKVHIPWETQLRIAGIIGMKLPTKRLISISVRTLSDKKIAEYQRRWYVRLRRCLNKIFEATLAQPEPSFHKTNKNYRREEQFLVKDRHAEFSPAQRSYLAMQILTRAKYGDEPNKFGINRLLAAVTYNTCFPLHEGEYFKSKPDGTYTDRQLLYKEWARASNWYKQQPLWLVQRYFGDQIGLYYAWLGFYTKMLVAPAVVGSLCFLYGIMSEDSKNNIPSKEICDVNGTGNITLCPLCDKACSYQKLYEACIFAHLTYYIDNPATVFFAVFMCFWATTFLVLWKREEAVYKWQWDLTGTDPDENPRPEYEASVTSTRINPITGTKEPYRSPWHTCVRRVAVSTVVLMMVAISIGTVLGVITYRISMVTVIYSSSGGILRSYARLFTIGTSALINLAVSETLIKIFTKVAMIITNLENPRTQTDYEDSVTFKMFIFEFINVYASIVYIAFFKGSFYVHPGDKEARMSPLMKIKGDICFQAGCLSELSIMLGVAMIGKQTFHNIKEMIIPMFLNWWRSSSHRKQTVDPSKPHMAWEQDYHLQDPGHMALYEEYLEMIMQYGFVTLFVAAFPLGPLCALINNICEIRMDAYKMVTQARRPMYERAEDIGAWYGLLRFLTYLAVVTNAFVIAYTSDFIPRIVYKYGYCPKHSLVGYVNFSLSWFNTSDYKPDWGSDDNEWDPPLCAYRGYRNPPDHPEPYGLSPYFWQVFAARMMFVVVFEHFVFVMTEIIHLIVPKVPAELVRQIKREQILEKELKYEKNTSTADDVEFFKLMAEGKGLKAVNSSDTGVNIRWNVDGENEESRQNKR